MYIYNVYVYIYIYIYIYMYVCKLKNYMFSLYQRSQWASCVFTQDWMKSIGVLRIIISHRFYLYMQSCTCLGLSQSSLMNFSENA